MAAKIKDQQTNLVATLAKQQLKPMKVINKITFIWRHKNKRKDFDNVEASQKFVRDGLVKAGIVEGDGWKHFPPRTLHKHEIDPTNPGVLVIIK